MTAGTHVTIMMSWRASRHYATKIGWNQPGCVQNILIPSRVNLMWGQPVNQGQPSDSCQDGGGSRHLYRFRVAVRAGFAFGFLLGGATSLCDQKDVLFVCSWCSNDAYRIASPSLLMFLMTSFAHPLCLPRIVLPSWLHRRWCVAQCAREFGQILGTNPDRKDMKLSSNHTGGGFKKNRLAIYSFSSFLPTNAQGPAGLVCLWIRAIGFLSPMELALGWSGAWCSLNFTNHEMF